MLRQELDLCFAPGLWNGPWLTELFPEKVTTPAASVPEAKRDPRRLEGLRHSMDSDMRLSGVCDLG